MPLILIGTYSNVLPMTSIWNSLLLLSYKILNVFIFWMFQNISVLKYMFGAAKEVIISMTDEPWANVASHFISSLNRVFKSNKWSHLFTDPQNRIRVKQLYSQCTPMPERWWLGGYRSEANCNQRWIKG